MAKNSPQDIKNRAYFSVNLNRIMKEKGVRQIDLHNNTGIPKSTITGYVKGSSLPTPGNLQKIADFLGVKKSDLDLRFIPKENISIYANSYEVGFDFGRLYGGIENLTQKDCIIINEGEPPWNLNSDLDLNLSKNLNKALTMLIEISEKEGYLSLKEDKQFITAINLIDGTINLNESNKESASSLISICDEIAQHLGFSTSDMGMPAKQKNIESKKNFNLLSWLKRG